MASRETQNLNEIIATYLGKKNFEKSLKLFEQESSTKNYGTANGTSDRAVLRNLEAFADYLKKKEVEGEKEDDLGFEINFDAYQPNKKVNFNPYPFIFGTIAERISWEKNKSKLWQNFSKTCVKWQSLF